MRDLILFSFIVLFSFNSVANDEAPEVPVESPLILEGSVDGYRTRNYDDKLDFGLVIPTLSREQILNFSLSSVLSTETDVIRAAGQAIRVPSNVSLPRQSERYFITIRINKPGFRLPIHFDSLPETVAVVEGSMPFTRTVDTLRGGSPLFSVINTFTFKSYSLSPISDLENDLELTAGENPIEGTTTTFDIPFPTDQDYISIGLNLDSTMDEAGNPLYFPINIKTLETPQNLRNTSEENVPVIVTVPKETFNSDIEETAGLPFPFSLVWGESQPEFMLPLGKDFATITSGEVDDAEAPMSIDIDESKFTDFSVLAYILTLFDENGEVLLTETHGPFIEGISWDRSLPAKRVRLDVLAADPDPVLESINSEYILNNDVFSQAKYISRYEDDLN